MYEVCTCQKLKFTFYCSNIANIVNLGCGELNESRKRDNYFIQSLIRQLSIHICEISQNAFVGIEVVYLTLSVVRD
jgi:hypothetical protein